MRSRSREDVSATSMLHSFILFSNFVLFVFHVGTTWNFVLPRLLAFTQAQKERDITLNLLLISCIRTKCSDQATKQRSSGDQVAIKEWSTSAQAVFKLCSISGVPPKFWFCPTKPIEDHECITFLWITSGMNQTLQMFGVFRTTVFELLQSFNTKNKLLA